MTIEEFAERFGVSVKSAKNYLGDYCRSIGIENKGRYAIDYSPELIQEAAHIRDLNHAPINYDFETDRDQLAKYMRVRYKQNETETGKMMRHKHFPQPSRVRKAGHKVYIKKDVEAFCEQFINGKVHGKTREIKGDAAILIFFLTGRYWRYGDKIKTRLIHSREV